MPVMIYDPEMEAEIRAECDREGTNRHEEVWEGVLVVTVLANNEHQRIVMTLCSAFGSALNFEAGDSVLPGANVSDRDSGWKDNYRCPDAVVYLATNPAKDANTHWVGGPDLAVEISSPGEDPRLKLDFYAKVNTRELLIVDRYPWAVELYRLAGGKMGLVGTATEANGAVLASAVLPFTLQVKAGAKRPAVHLVQTATGQTWTA
jgi:Uma2 family endonuclease